MDYGHGHRLTGRTIGQIPAIVSRSCYAVYKTSVAIGTESGRLFVIQIPPSIFMIPDTRVAEATGWRPYLRSAWEHEPCQVDRDRGETDIAKKSMSSEQHNLRVDDDVSQLPGDQ
jgi:hypothetical protein